MNILVVIAFMVQGSDQLAGAVVVGATDSFEHCADMAAAAERGNADYIAKVEASGGIAVAVCTKMAVTAKLPKSRVPPRADDTPT